MTINNQVDAKALLQQVASMSVKAGEDIKNGAGWGYVGMMNGMVVKMGTHYRERHGDWAKNKAMIETSCAELCEALGQAMDKLQMDDKTKKNIRNQLGLSEGPNVVNKPLLKRSVVLKAVQDIAKAIHNKDLLTGLKGSATIVNTGAEKVEKKGAAAEPGLTSKVDDIVEKRDGLFKDGGKFTNVLEKLLPGKLFEPRRAQICEFAKNQFLMTGSELGVRRPPSTGKGANNLSDEDIIKALTNGLPKKEDVGKIEEFEKAVGALFKMTEAEYQKFLENIKPVAVGPAEKVITLVMPKEFPKSEKHADDDLRRFERFKAVAIQQPSKPNPNGKGRMYSAYGTWLLEAAVHYTQKTNDSSKNLQTLTLDDMGSFLNECNDKDPAKPGGESFLSGVGSNGFLGMNCKIKDIFGIRNGSSYLEGFKSWLSALDGSKGAVSSDTDKIMLGAFSVCGQHGGLVFAHKEKFFIDDNEKTTATSEITPLLTQSDPKSQLHNLASTKLTNEKEQTLFHGLRFASRDLEGKNPTDQKVYYGQLVEQTLLDTIQHNAAFKETVDRLPEEGVIDLPIVRIDMSDAVGLTTFAEKYTVTLPNNKKVTVRPQVAHFRMPTDNAQCLKFGEKGVWCVMSKEDIRKTKLALELLGDQVNKVSRDGKVGKLWNQINNNWNAIVERHSVKGVEGKDPQAIEFYENCGADMMRLGAMISVLANELGLTPAINCDGGRDRTGLMDTECKTLALWMQDKNHPLSGLEEEKTKEQKNGEFSEQAKELRRNVRKGSGNQAIAREITLKNVDMLMEQAKNHAKDAEKKAKESGAKPLPRPKYLNDHSSGLDVLYS